MTKAECEKALDSAKMSEEWYAALDMWLDMFDSWKQAGLFKSAADLKLMLGDGYRVIGARGNYYHIYRGDDLLAVHWIFR